MTGPVVSTHVAGVKGSRTELRTRARLAWQVPVTDVYAHWRHLGIPHPSLDQGSDCKQVKWGGSHYWYPPRFTISEGLHQADAVCHRSWWWLHEYILISKRIKWYTLNMYSVCHVNHTSIKWFLKMQVSTVQKNDTPNHLGCEVPANINSLAAMRNTSEQPVSEKSLISVILVF